MVYVPKRLFDGEIAKPSGREIAKYGRREFLYALGAAAVAAGCGSDGNGNGGCVGPTCPTATYTVAGSVRGTYGNNMLAPVTVRFGDQSQNSDNGNYSLSVNGGVYNPTVSGGRVQRVRNNVNIEGNPRLDLDVLDRDINVNHYREIGMGIGSPGALMNQGGRSYRLRDGVQPRVIVVRDAGVNADRYAAIDQARSVFGEITGDILNQGTMESVDSAESNLPEGAIVVNFRPGALFGTAPSIRDGFYLKKCTINASNSNTMDQNIYRKAMKHEFCHAIGFDHATNNQSIMSVSLAGHNGMPSRDDIDAGVLKYRRLGGHELDEMQDRD